MGLFINKTKERLQVDPIECGAVCLGIILEYLGNNQTNFALRDACEVSRHGAEAQALIKGAGYFGLVAQAQKVLASDLKNVLGPAVLFFDQCHFVVFEGCFLGRYYINDPALGRYSLDGKVFHQRFSNVAIFFSAEEKLIRNISENASKGHALAAFCLIFLGLIGGLGLAIFSAIGGLVISSGNVDRIVPIWVVAAVVMVSIVLIIASLLSMEEIIADAAQEESEHEIRFLQKSLTEVPLGFFAEVPFASFMRSYSGSIDTELYYFRWLLQRYFSVAFIAIIAFVAVCMAPINSVGIAGVFMLSALQYYGRRAYMPNHTVGIAPQDIEKARLLSPDMHAMGQHNFISDGLLSKRLNLLPPLVNPDINFLGLLLNKTLLAAVLLVFMATILPNLWQHGAISMAEVMSCFVLGWFMLATQACLLLHPNKAPYKESVAFKSELIEQLKLDEKIIKKENPDHLLEIHNVSFYYRGESEPVLHNVDLTIKKGHTIGIKGPGNCGTSTLLKIVAKRLAPTSGQIIQDAALRIAFLDEDTEVMSATLKDNVTLFDDSMSDEMVVKSLKDACALDLFYNRPLGLLAHIEKHGLNLSASEKYRLILAQALAHDPHIVVIDDVFYALDEKIALSILHNLAARGIATIFSSTQNSLFDVCDHVITLDNKTKNSRGES